MKKRFCDEVEQVLLKAGWHEGRTTPRALREKWSLVCEPNFKLFPAAEKVLNEFGGLKILQGEPGEERLREDFEIDPTLLDLSEEDFYIEYEEYFGARIFPLGECCNYNDLVIDNTGRTILLGVGDEILGANFDEALSNLILGRKGKLIPEF